MFQKLTLVTLLFGIPSAFCAEHGTLRISNEDSSSVLQEASKSLYQALVSQHAPMLPQHGSEGVAYAVRTGTCRRTRPHPQVEKYVYGCQFGDLPGAPTLTLEGLPAGVLFNLVYRARNDHLKTTKVELERISKLVCAATGLAGNRISCAIYF
jgi:hypothetical protein